MKVNLVSMIGGALTPCSQERNSEVKREFRCPRLNEKREEKWTHKGRVFLRTKTIGLQPIVIAQLCGLMVRIGSLLVLSASAFCVASSCFLCSACAVSLVVSSKDPRLHIHTYAHDFALGTVLGNLGNGLDLS
jgi:hypothetical protein